MTTRQQLVAGYNSVLSIVDTTVHYNKISGGWNWGTNENDFKAIVPTDGTITEFAVRCSVTPDTGTDGWDFYVRIEGTDYLNVAIKGSNIEDSATGTIDVSAGDEISVKYLVDGTPDGASPRAYYSIKFEPDTEDETIILGGHFNQLLTDGTREYTHLAVGVTWTATEADRFQIIPTDGTLKSLYVGLLTAPGTGDTWTFWVRKNESDTGALSCTISESALTGNDLTTELSVSAGDRVSISYQATAGTPAATYRVWWGVVFVPDITGETIVLGGTSDDLLNTTTEYMSTTGFGTWGTWEAGRRSTIANDAYIEKLNVRLTANPGATSSWAFTMREDSVDSGVTFSISGSETAGDSGHLRERVNAFDALTLKCAPTTTPSGADAAWGFVIRSANEFERTFVESIVLDSRDAKPVFAEDFEGTIGFDGTQIDASQALTGKDTTKPASGQYNLKATMLANADDVDAYYYEEIDTEVGDEAWIVARNVSVSGISGAWGDAIRIIILGESALDGALVQLAVMNNSGTEEWVARCLTAGTTTWQNIWDSPFTDGQVLGEIMLGVKRGNGDGWVKVYLDGVRVAALYNLDNDGRTLSYALVGAWSSDADTVDTYVYMDDVKVYSEFPGVGLTKQTRKNLEDGIALMETDAQSWDYYLNNENTDLSDYTGVTVNTGCQLYISNQDSFRGAWSQKSVNVSAALDSTCARMENIGDWSEIYVSFAFKVDTPPPSTDDVALFSMWDSAWNGTWALYYERWGGSPLTLTLLNQAPAVSEQHSYEVDLGTTWHTVQIYYKYHDTAGEIKVWLDGVVIVDEINQDCDSGGVGLDHFFNGIVSAGYGPLTVHIDELIVSQNPIADPTTYNENAPTFAIGKSLTENVYVVAGEKSLAANPVERGTDDASFRGALRDFYTDDLGIYLAHTQWAITYEAGIRFTAVPIPQGATIESAIVRIQVAPNWNGDTITLRGQAADNAATFSTEVDFDGRSQTTASVVWTTGVVSADTDEDTDDISEIIQEIVDRPGWRAGNALAILTEADDQNISVARAWDSGETPPRLIVTYSHAGVEKAVVKAPLTERIDLIAPDSTLKFKALIDEGKGDTIRDTSISQLTGTINGPTWTDGKIGGGIFIDGGGTDNVDFGTIGTLHCGTGDMAISLWFKTTADISGGGNDQRSIFDYGGSSDFYEGVRIVWYTTTDYIWYTFSDGIYRTLGTTATGLAKNAWTHFVISYDRDGNATAYINGSVSGTPVSLAGSSGNMSGTAQLLLGKYVFTTDRSFDGTIDEVKVFHRTLSQEDVTDLFNLGAGKFATKDITKAPFAESISLVATDLVQATKNLTEILDINDLAVGTVYTPGYEEFQKTLTETLALGDSIMKNISRTLFENIRVGGVGVQTSDVSEWSFGVESVSLDKEIKHSGVGSIKGTVVGATVDTWYEMQMNNPPSLVPPLPASGLGAERPPYYLSFWFRCTQASSYFSGSSYIRLQNNTLGRSFGWRVLDGDWTWAADTWTYIRLPFETPNWHIADFPFDDIEEISFTPRTPAAGPVDFDFWVDEIKFEIDGLEKDIIKQPLVEAINVTDSFLKIVGKNLVESISLSDSILKRVGKQLQEKLSVFKRFGISEQLGSNLGITYNSNYCKFTNVKDATITHIASYVWHDELDSPDTGKRWRGAIYNSSLDRLGMTEKVRMRGYDNKNWDFAQLISPVTIQKDQTYWIGVSSDGSEGFNMYMSYDTNGETNQRIYQYDTDSNPPDPLVPTSYFDHRLSVYAVYLSLSKDITKAPFIETLALTDTILHDSLLTLTETLTLADDIMLVAGKSLSENLTLTDTVFWGSMLTLIESISLTDVLQRTQLKNLSEQLTLVDTFTRQNAWFKDFSETLILIDIVTPFLFKNVFLTETIGLIASLTLQKTFIRELIETATLVETLTKYVTTEFVETITLDDNISAFKLLVVTLNETLIMTDTLTRQLNFFREFVEPLTLVETLQMFTSRMMSETVGLSDLLTKDVALPLLEQISLVDTALSRVALEMVEIVNLTDSLARKVALIKTEALTLTDTVTTQSQLIKELTEVITLVDTKILVVARSLTEIINLADTVATDSGLFLLLTETLVLIDTIEKQTSRILAETLTLADDILKIVGKNLTEAITLSDTVFWGSAFRLTLTEVINLVSSITLVPPLKIIAQQIELDLLRFKLKLSELRDKINVKRY